MKQTTTEFGPAPFEYRDIIRALGGASALAASLDLPPQRVHKWAQRNYIPPEYDPVILAFARKKRAGGITHQLFRTLRAREALAIAAKRWRLAQHLPGG